MTSRKQTLEELAKKFHVSPEMLRKLVEVQENAPELWEKWHDQMTTNPNSAPTVNKLYKEYLAEYKGDKRVGISAKVEPEVRARLKELAKEYGMTLGELITIAAADILTLEEKLAQQRARAAIDSPFVDAWELERMRQQQELDHFRESDTEFIEEKFGPNGKRGFFIPGEGYVEPDE